MNKNMVKACQMTDKVFGEVIAGFSEFDNEKNVSRFITRRFRELGAGLAFPSIVANNNSVIHPRPRGGKFSRGFCIIDMGARVGGMSADMTRTIFIGKPNKKERELYRMILMCQKNCIARVRAGMLAAELDAYARTFLGKYRKYFTHALGHGVGEKIHQRPKIVYRLRKGENLDRIPSGECIAIEPGIYMKGRGGELGIRIEDTVYVGRSSVKVLTNSEKGLIELPIGKG